MIVPMKKVLLLAVASEKEAALDALRDAGVMQITTTGTTTRKTDYAATTLAFGRKVSAVLKNTAAGLENIPECQNVSGQEIVEKCGVAIERQSKLAGEIETIQNKLKQLAPWGYFDRASLDGLNEKGVDIQLCSASAREFSKLSEIENISLVELRREKGKIYFAAVCCGADPEALLALPAVKLNADDNPAMLQKKLNELLGEYNDCTAVLQGFAGCTGVVEEYLLTLESDWEFSQAMDSCVDHRAVISLGGFVPDFSVAKLQEYAGKHGWGLVISDPEASDDVPVLLKESKFSRTIKPLFDFLGILPGYREMDISGGVLIFFTVFYAMIIGDAGYGLLFTLASLLGTLKFRHNEKARTPLKLAWILSIATVIWGGLSGSFFGVEVGGLPCLTGESKNTVIQIFCFLLAVAQLSLGHIWSAIHQRNWKSFGSHAGWTLIILANFFLAVRIIVVPGDFPQYMYYFYGAGLLLVLLCGIDWKNAADVFQFPFSVIGSFSDLLSYIRLFAVGMSGAYIASNFNGMGMDVIHASPWLILAGAVVIVLGHLLNISLAMMSVLVHAVRLNTLEFSNHTGLTWSGNAFRPFKNKSTSNKKEK